MPRSSPLAWYPDWRGETCVVVASGPSAAGVLLEAAPPRAKIIAVNDSWRLCAVADAPADALYACDELWWEKERGCPAFAGLRISIDRAACERWPGLHFVDCDRGTDELLTEPPGTIGWGGNSGFGALNLAVQFGAARIVLVGFDLTLEQGLHWHGPHPVGLTNPQPNWIARWRRAIDNAYPVLARLGISAVNCSPQSALANYPKMDFLEALDG